MYPKWIKWLFLYFDLWGLCTQFRKCTNQPNFKVILFILHLVLASVATIIIVLHLLRSDIDKMARLNDSLKFAVIFVAHWVSLIELYSKQTLHKIFWIFVFSIDQNFCSHQQFKLTNYLNRMKIYFSLAAIAYGFYFHTLIHNSGSKFIAFWLSYSFLVLFFKTRSFYYVFYLELIKNELKMIDHELATILDDCNSMKSKNFMRNNQFAEQIRSFQQNRFKWIRQYYELVYNLCGTVNTMFGRSNIVIISLTFHLILIDINWFYWKLLNKYQFNVNGNDNVKFKSLKQLIE